MFTFSLSGLEIKTQDGGPLEVEENETTARSAVYMVLGSFFQPVCQEQYDKAINDHLDKEMKESASLLPFEFDTGVPSIKEGSTFDDYKGEYVRVFGDELGAGSLLLAGDDENVIAQLKRDYEYFGLGVGEDKKLDHLSTALDFMQYVCFKEAASPSPRLKGSYRRAQRDFLEQNLVNKIPNIVDKAVALNPADPFNWGLTRLNAFVEADFKYITSLLG